jgi:hypothetical protein
MNAPETPAEPSSSHPATDGAVVRCAGCGQENAPGSDQCAAPNCRKVLKGNELSRRTNLHAAASTPELQAIEAAGRALVSQSIADAGGRSELIARELSDHEYRGLLHIRILKLASALDAHGEFDKRGRLRKSWIELLDRLITSAVGIDKTLGLKRRPRRVPSVAEYVAQAAATRQEP